METGIDGVWLSPIFASPMVDGGYDIDDFRNIHPKIGSMEDFHNLIDRAHNLSLKVSTEIFDQIHFKFDILIVFSSSWIWCPTTHQMITSGSKRLKLAMRHIKTTTFGAMELDLQTIRNLQTTGSACLVDPPGPKWTTLQQSSTSISSTDVNLT